MSEAEQTTQEDVGMSSEEKFLGIKSQIGTKPDEDVEAQAEIDIEVVDSWRASLAGARAEWRQHPLSAQRRRHDAEGFLFVCFL